MVDIIDINVIRDVIKERLEAINVQYEGEQKIFTFDIYTEKVKIWDNYETQIPTSNVLGNLEQLNYSLDKENAGNSIYNLQMLINENDIESVKVLALLNQRINFDLITDLTKYGDVYKDFSLILTFDYMSTWEEISSHRGNTIPASIMIYAQENKGYANGSEFSATLIDSLGTRYPINYEDFICASTKNVIAGNYNSNGFIASTPTSMNQSYTCTAFAEKNSLLRDVIIPELYTRNTANITNKYILEIVDCFGVTTTRTVAIQIPSMVSKPAEKVIFSLVMTPTED